jgi:antitoxin VapB
MPQTAKLFMNGRSQAVRLPVNCRFDSNEVYISKDSKTGDVIISEKPNSWDELFELIECISTDESIERDNDPLIEKDLF